MEDTEYDDVEIDSQMDSFIKRYDTFNQNNMSSEIELQEPLGDFDEQKSESKATDELFDQNDFNIDDLELDEFINQE